MSAWGDSELLVQLLDRQFAFLLDLAGTAQLIRLPRLLSFVGDEPQIAGFLEDMKAEAAEELERYETSDANVRHELARLWGLHGPEVRSRLSNLSDESLSIYCPLATFEEAIGRRTRASFVLSSNSFEQVTRTLVLAFRDWWKRTDDRAEQSNVPLSGEYGTLGTKLNRILARHAFAARRLEEGSGSLGWPAYQRLLANATVTNPVPPDGSNEAAWAMFPADSEFAKALARADAQGVSGVESVDVDDVYDSVTADAKLLHQELRHRIGQARSRLALVQRYAARCEAFDSERLRSACENDSGNAERLLTLDLARFLFDAGLPPIIDVTIGGLRPDLVHVLPTSLFYVEAKQYHGAHPKSQLKKAYSQVWGTWGRLRKTNPSHEAFLVVFRRAGPWVELPPVLHHQGLKLYSVVADISTQAGSREKHPVTTLTEEELRPQEDDA